MNTSDDWPLVSVILAVRNGERFLAEALRSVQAQRYPAWELLVVDGHSTDGTETIARSFPQAQWHVQPGRGLPDAWNYGLARARGEWIALLEYDDIWLPEKLPTHIAFMRAHPPLQYTLSHAEFFLEPGCAWPRGYNPEWLKRPQIGSFLSVFVARKSAFAQVGGFDSRWHSAADMDWFARAKDKKIPMAYLPETLARKRVHDANLTAQTESNHAELLQVMRQTLNRKRQAPEVTHG